MTSVDHGGRLPPRSRKNQSEARSTPWNPHGSRLAGRQDLVSEALATLAARPPLTPEQRQQRALGTIERSSALRANGLALRPRSALHARRREGTQQVRMDVGAPADRQRVAEARSRIAQCT